MCVEVLERALKATMDYEVDDVSVDFSANILWKIEDMDSENKSIVIEKDANVVVKFAITLLFYDKMKK